MSGVRRRRPERLELYGARDLIEVDIDGKHWHEIGGYVSGDGRYSKARRPATPLEFTRYAQPDLPGVGGGPPATLLDQRERERAI